MHPFHSKLIGQNESHSPFQLQWIQDVQPTMQSEGENVGGGHQEDVIAS